MSDANACGCQGRLRCGYHEGFEDGKATLAKRVEELEAVNTGWYDYAERARLLAVVEAARSLVRAYRSATLYQRIGQPLGVLRNEDITSIARAERGIIDALAAFDKEK